MGSQLQVALIALGGVVVGSVFSIIGNYFIQRSLRSWLREQWLLDKKTAEYRELLSSLAGSVESMAQNSPDFGMAVAGGATDEQRLPYDAAAAEARKTIHDRIFISKSIQDACIRSLWQALAGERDMSNFWNSWDHLHSAIITTAHQELGIKIDN